MDGSVTDGAVYDNTSFFNWAHDWATYNRW